MYVVAAHALCQYNIVQVDALAAYIVVAYTDECLAGCILIICEHNELHIRERSNPPETEEREVVRAKMGRTGMKP